MAKPIRNLAIVVNEARSPAREVADEVTAEAGRRGIDVLEWRFGDAPPAAPGVIVGIGGDGTVLSAATLAIAVDAPVVGLNLGSVGYLADVDPTLVVPMLDGLTAGTLQAKTRMTVRAHLPGGESWLGINDVVLEKVVGQRIVQISVEIGGEYFTTYRGDGIIIATPLGSTAYSLSAGGPVLDPALDALILTPVAPHSLLSRSIVLAPDATFQFRVAMDRSVRVNLDGREAAVVDEGDTITVQRGEPRVTFLSLGEHPFPQAVRHQFGLDHA